MNDQKLRDALKACLSEVDFPQECQCAVLRTVRKDEPIVKRKLSVVAICVMVLMLALGGMALAASLGVFGLAGRTNEQSANRLALLENRADTLNEAQTVQAGDIPGEEHSPQNLYEELLSGIYARQFELTVNQSYSDGYKLYYAYTLTTNVPLNWYTGVGAPKGIEEWYMQAQGTYAQNYTQYDEEDEQRYAAFFTAHPVGYIARETMALGDGADYEGQPLNILDSGETWVDECTLQGYQEVALPDGFDPKDGTATIQLKVMYGASVTYQDKDNVYCAHITTPENRGILPLNVTVPVNGQTQSYSGRISTEAYSASVTIRVSDVDISGQIVFAGTTPVLDYGLLADGVIYPNLDGAFVENENGQTVLYVRFDLPQSMDHFSLVPIGTNVELIPLVKQ